jgi:hypothetical protein
VGVIVGRDVGEGTAVPVASGVTAVGVGASGKSIAGDRAIPSGVISPAKETGSASVSCRQESRTRIRKMKRINRLKWRINN